MKSIKNMESDNLECISKEKMAESLRTQPSTDT